MSVTVANKSRYRGAGDHARAGEPVGVSITPPSALANHFKTSKALDRASMVARYAAWLDAQLADPASAAAREFARLRALLDAYGALTLLCSCAPLPCHGDAIRARLLDHSGKMGGTLALAPGDRGQSQPDRRVYLATREHPDPGHTDFLVARPDACPGSRGERRITDEQPYPSAAPRRAVLQPTTAGCAACGGAGLAGLIAYPDDTASPVVLCVACAHDRASVRLLLWRLGPGPLTIVSQPGC